MTDVVGELRASDWPWKWLEVLRLLYTQPDVSLAPLVDLVRSDSDEMLAALDRARLTGPFCALASGTPVFEALPEAARETLGKTYALQRETNAAYLQLLGDYTDRLGHEGVDVLLLKGLYIGQRFYADAGQRFSWDADVLVRPEGFRRAIAVAGELGMPVSGPQPSRWLLRLASLHAVEVRRKAHAIDIHWCLRARPGYRIDYDALWDRTCAMDIGGLSFRVLADEDALFLALLELASDMERSRIKLRSLWDFYRIMTALDSQLDWPLFFERRRCEGLLPLAINMLGFGLRCVNGYADFPVVATALEEHADLLLIDSGSKAREILERPQKNMANRALYARLQPASAAAYWLRRALTSPLRNALVS